MRRRGIQGARGEWVAARGVLSLEMACEVVAGWADVEVARVLAGVGRAVVSFFPGARRNGDGSWRIPAGDVRALLEGERLLKPVTFAEMGSVSVGTVREAMRDGRIGWVWFLGERRIPLSEFVRNVSVEVRGAERMGPADGSSDGGGRLSFLKGVGR